MVKKIKSGESAFVDVGNRRKELRNDKEESVNEDVEEFEMQKIEKVESAVQATTSATPVSRHTNQGPKTTKTPQQEYEKVKDEQEESLDKSERRDSIPTSELSRQVNLILQSPSALEIIEEEHDNQPFNPRQQDDLEDFVNPDELDRNVSHYVEVAQQLQERPKMSRYDQFREECRRELEEQHPISNYNFSSDFPSRSRSFTFSFNKNNLY